MRLRLKLAVSGLQLAVLGLLVACSHPNGQGTTSPTAQNLGDRLIPTIDSRATKINAKGFEIVVADAFEHSGEEKVQFSHVQVSWPAELPPESEWMRTSDAKTDAYQSRGFWFGMDWGPFGDWGDPFKIVELAVKYPNGQSPKGQSVKTGPVTWRYEVDDSTSDRWYRWTAYASPEFWSKSRGRSVSNPARPDFEYPTISVDGPIEDHDFVIHLPIKLCYATQRPQLPVSKYGFAPFGLNNSLYFGHTFWDMDVWVLPSMLFLQPDAVRQMNQYRLDRAAQAEKNAAEFFKKPNSGMMFPWESSVSGKETVRASSVKEHHISGSVLWGLNMSEKAGISSSSEVGKVASGVSRFFDARSVTGPNGREIKDVMSPDENHIGDNDLYTNLLAQWAMNGRKWDGATKFKLPKDEKSFLTYDSDKERGYKQAAAVLSIFPLQYPPAEKQARAMMERFEGKVSKNGPAMSDAIHATIWARLGDKEKAYDAWKRAWEPFVKGPQMMFSEKRSSERTYFYTGAAGCLNTVIYGFAGFRFDEKPLEGAVWKKQLKSGWWLSCKPCLPPKWKSLNINPMIIDGQKYSVEITPEKVDIQPVSGP